MSTIDLASKIRDVPDFPQPGVVFKDIMPLLADGEALGPPSNVSPNGPSPAGRTSCWAQRRAATSRAERSPAGSAAASSPARKPGKLPWHTVAVKYALEYGFDTLELHADAITAASAS